MVYFPELVFFECESTFPSFANVDLKVFQIVFHKGSKAITQYVPNDVLSWQNLLNGFKSQTGKGSDGFPCLPNDDLKIF